MITFRFDEAAVKGAKLGVTASEFAGEDLKFLTAPSLNETAADEVIDPLVPRPAADRSHQAANPRTGIGLTEGNAALFQKVQYQLEMLQFFNRNRVELVDPRKQVTKFLQI